MELTPLANGSYDPAAHIQTLKNKRETISKFALVCASLLAKLVGGQAAQEWCRAADALLGFDVDSSIAILEQQRLSRRDNLQRAIVQLTDRKNKMEETFEQARTHARAALKSQTGVENDELIAMLMLPMTQQVTMLDQEISRIQAELEQAPTGPEAA